MFVDTGIPASAIHLEPASSLQMPTWNFFSSSMEIQPNGLNCSSEHSSDCFFNPNWERSKDHSLHFDSALSSKVSSPAVSKSNISSESFVMRELIGRLGNIGKSGNMSPHYFASHMNNSNDSANTSTTSCYTTALNSPPKVNLPIVDHLVKEKLPNWANSMTLNSSLAEVSADPGFAQRASKFSRFGGRSFSGRTSHFAPNNPEFGFRSNPLMSNEKLKLPRVSSSPSLKVLGSLGQANGFQGNKNPPLQDISELSNYQKGSSVSEQVHQNESGSNLKTSNDFNSKKRKAVSKGQERAASPSANNTKVAETESKDNCNSNNKRCKPNEGSTGEEAKTAEDDKQIKTNNAKPPWPPRDYIHVRARRGQATDSHSLSERVRREKISERMKLLQDLVPGCNKVTGKALMLDEIINYVQSLQRQVEFLSMKLVSVNTRLDFNLDASMSKDDIYQTNKPLPHPIFPLDSSASAIFGQCSVHAIDNTTCGNLNMQMQLPQLDQFTETILPPQHINFCEDDLQSIVQMGFGHNLNGMVQIT